MEKIKEVIVVEGKNDTLNLKKYFDVDTIETHGLGLNSNTLKYIKEIHQRRGIILFLDPDTPGDKIRNKINQAIPNLKNAYIDKHVARTSKKVGVEHAKKEDLEESLNNLVTFGDSKNSITYDEFLELGLAGEEESSSIRERVGIHFHLGKCNGKQLYKRLNMAGISKEDIIKVINGK